MGIIMKSKGSDLHVEMIEMNAETLTAVLNRLEMVEKRLELLEAGAASAPVSSVIPIEVEGQFVTIDGAYKVPTAVARGAVMKKSVASALKYLMLKTWEGNELIGVNLSGHGPAGKRAIDRNKLSAFIYYAILTWSGTRQQKIEDLERSFNDVSSEIGKWLPTVPVLRSKAVEREAKKRKAGVPVLLEPADDKA